MTLQELSNKDLLPLMHQKYLYRMRNEMNIHPNIVYDIGASVLHWYKAAHRVWPKATYIAFEAIDECEVLYQREGLSHYMGVLGLDKISVTFWGNAEHPGGSSYYKENVLYSPTADTLYSPRLSISRSLDSVVAEKGFPLPTLIKMDVQGAELDIIKGSPRCFKACSHLILELQKVEYNCGAPLRDEVIAYLISLGFKLVTPLFSDNGFDGDYHFTKVPQSS